MGLYITSKAGPGSKVSYRSYCAQHSDPVRQKDFENGVVQVRGDCYGAIAIVCSPVSSGFRVNGLRNSAMAFFGTTPFPSTLPPTSPTLPPQCPIDLISKAKQQSLYKSRKDRLRTDGDPAAAADDDAFEYLDPAALEALYQKQCQASTLGMVRFELDRCRLICDQVRGWPRGQAREVFRWRPGTIGFVASPKAVGWLCGPTPS